MDIDKQFWQTFQKFSGEVGESFNLSLFSEIIELRIKKVPSKILLGNMALRSR